MSTSSQQSNASPEIISVRGGEVQRGPISATAILAFLCAIASLLGLFNMLLWFLAPTGLALALLSLLLIRRRRDDVVRGRKLAVAAMAMATGIGTWGLVHPNIHRQFLCRQADQFTREWLHLVQSGDLPRAYAMVGEARQTTSFSPPQAQAQMHAFFGQEPFYTITRSKGTFTPHGVVEYVEWPLEVEITLRYDYRPHPETSDVKIPVIVKIARHFHFQKGYFFWYISEVQSTPKSTS